MAMTLHRRGPIYDIGQLSIDKSYYRKQAAGLYLDNLVIAVLCFALPTQAKKLAWATRLPCFQIKSPGVSNTASAVRYSYEKEAGFETAFEY
jgi:hypothetical protein